MEPAEGSVEKSPHEEVRRGRSFCKKRGASRCRCHTRERKAGTIAPEGEERKEDEHEATPNINVVQVLSGAFS